MKRVVGVGAMVVSALCAAVFAGQAPEAIQGAALAKARGDQAATANASRLEVIATFPEMPTGVAVSKGNRVFVSFPRWGDPVASTVVELKAGKPVAYPNVEMNTYNPEDAAGTFVSVQSVVVDSENRLWVLDSGNLQMGKNLPHGPKLVGIDLATNKVVKKIAFPADVVLPTTYLNDVRIDVDRGQAGTAYITDSASEGEAGIIVVDLASAESWRRLSGEPSVSADAHFVPTVEGEKLEVREAGKPAKPLTVGADSIALSPDGKRLYWRPLASHHLYSVATSLLVDRTAEVEQVSDGVKDLGELDFASDGMAFDKEGILYLTDYEHHAIRRGDPTESPAKFEVFVSDPRMIWPDTLSFSSEGALYISVNQLNRAGRFHEGKDLRVPPYAVMRIKLAQ